eukprot:CAMPEP_0119024042 /NCGR_PEP_ID=MMETSP1176-20130426/31141_1 /TAXON_ID=265551 /ORGANISM="Synedropsis recta cf, Strain CCMP1620" /LENGTH=539 /DNA_ID=CAMNT_0006979233 /DNA_START=29 /DNA_END=1648 /DNA_ORIENTATION=+
MMGVLASKRTFVGGIHLLGSPFRNRTAFATAKTFSESPIDRISTILDSNSKNNVASAPPLMMMGRQDTSYSSSSTQNNNITTLEDLSKRLSQEYDNLPALTTSRGISEGNHTRGEIMQVLASELGTNHDSILKAAQSYSNLTPEASDIVSHRRTQLATKLREACTPQYEQLFHNIMAENSHVGIRFFVQLRQDLLQYIRMHRDDDESRSEELPYLKQLDASLKVRLATWFSADMIEIRRITYEGTSADVIEKIATKEAVHPMQSLDDLRRRLGPDKRVFCAFHPSLPEEPLCFVHVALRSFIPSSMDQVLSDNTTSTTTTDNYKSTTPPTVATFYSISSTQPGLSGIDLGQVVIKRATQLLQQELASLETFVTLSPLTRFRSWLQDKLKQNQDGGTFVDSDFLSDHDLELLRFAFQCSPEEDVAALFLKHLEDPWTLMSSSEYASSLEPLLTKLAARYVVLEKHRRKPLEGVARFHLANGAEVHRLNYMADTSRKGLHNSLGIMVNYQYNLKTVNKNRDRHAQDWTIPVQKAVKRWLLL